MKKRALILLTALAVVGCNTDKTEKEKDSQKVVLGERDTMLNNYLSSFTSIERTLDSISEKQTGIFIPTEKIAEPKAEIINKINLDIASINDLIKKNKEVITQLNIKLKTANTKDEGLEKVVLQLNDKLSQKQKELTQLNTKLNKFSAQIVVLYTDMYLLRAENDNQADIINEQTKALHTAYYIVGTSSYLEKEKIVDKKGGVLGLGKTAELNNDFNANKFKRIDYIETVSIPVNSKEVQIVTSHPTNSYRLEKEKGIVKSLTITNAEEFWKISKYLIIIKGS